MANRKATFAKRQRETDLKDRAKQKEDRRTQKRGEVREAKGPQIAWDEAVYAVTSDDPPLIGSAGSAGSASEGEEGDADSDADDAPDGPTTPASAAPPVAVPAASAAPTKPTSGSSKSGPVATKPATSPSPASPRRVG